MKQLKYDSHSSEVQYLVKKDLKLKELFSKIDEVIVNISDDYFDSLVGTIVAQQLSGKVARVIYKRVSDLFDNEITANKVLSASEESMRSVGLSYQKIKYLKSLSECYLNQIIDLNHLDLMTNDEISDMLIKIKGIGPWSAQMFLMFSLGREDVFSTLDLGLRNAVKKLYQNQELTNQEIDLISENWKPYRSIVAHYLWHVSDKI